MAKRRPPSVHGLLVVDKPAGLTSHDVVGRVRRRFDERRVGHAGTLDPDATGVLLVGVGSVTRLLTFLVGHDKTYRGEVVLGVATSTLDASGDVVGTADMSDVTIHAARLAAAHLTGPIMQVPPMVSALKVDGRRLHELAREGQEIERQPRPVSVHRFDVAEGPEPGVLSIEVECSAGTYVRSLAADLGSRLGGAAHLRNLRRVASGGFTIAEASPWETADLHPPLAAVRGMSVVHVDEATTALVRHGRVLDAWDGSGPWAVVDPGNALLAVYEPYERGRAKPAVVLAS
jgi:tRNA pseudouridine55 synthase